MQPIFSVVIPARFASTRLPGKPLADIGGLPMIVHVARRALASGAREVVVATDDARVQRAVVDHGLDAVLTRADHQSGSDRVMEVVSAKAWPDDHIVVNVQGDEPLIPPVVIAQVVQLLLDAPNLLVATLCEAIDGPARLFDPNVVKVVRDVAGRARYFSRAPIPHVRDPRNGWPPLYRHVGLYAYRRSALLVLAALEPTPLERAEALEQLRALEHGIRIRAVETRYDSLGVDTPEDLEQVRRLIAAPTT